MAKKSDAAAIAWLILSACMIIGVALVSRSVGWTLISIPIVLIVLRQFVND